MFEVFFLFLAASALAGQDGSNRETTPNDGSRKMVGKFEACYFSTVSLPPPFKVGKQFENEYKLFKQNGKSVSESVVVKSVVLLGNTRLGLTKEESKQLFEQLETVYQKIDKDSLFQNIPSALPYCLSDERPTKGHYFIYYPAKITAETPFIVFLHGFGGNMLFNAYVLKEEFPNAVIVLPSWSASWAEGKMQYLDDLYQDVKQQKSITIRKPILMAISAGERAGFRLYNEKSEEFSCYVSLASAPARSIVPALKKDLKILMVNGNKDSGFPIKYIQPTASTLTERLPHFRLEVLDSDHFFFLSKQKEAFSIVKAFLEKEGALANETKSTQ